ncbi:fumarate hydratase [Anaerocolumna xylanovorans]|uniref:Fumarate hydratase subunit alpha n=1 Tax=Anaerocolumna xylanovorans DSM 12503 TaxID=1121345 RepID=A0A1M7YNV2_9FIRM|nr:fumarate hydratase [Anaerocolumna xylanovorans]SHO54277.1 fumarate hydratase subunit alpha [Anaerocolumna xylanovorans DSM 12503]
MRVIHTDVLTQNIKEMCIEANYQLSADINNAISKGAGEEKSILGRQILGQLEENMKIAREEGIPICQDTGMAIIFMKIGQQVVIEGNPLEDAINEGIRQGYKEGYLRKSVVSDPLIRENTNDNTPGIIHYEIIPGENIEITVAPKGFGSENMSRIYMLKPADGVEGIKKAVIETVRLAGPNACPPIVVGVGIGGSFEKAAILSKKALTRSIDKSSEIEHIKNLEQELLKEINELGIGPGGFGGKVTALGVNIEVYPTHIAALPVAINICCHVNRHLSRII